MVYSEEISAGQCSSSYACNNTVLWSKQRNLIGHVDISVRDITADSGYQWESAQLYVWLCYGSTGTPVWSRNLVKQWGNPTPWLRITGNPFMFGTWIKLKTRLTVVRAGWGGYQEVSSSWKIWMQWDVW